MWSATTHRSPPLSSLTRPGRMKTALILLLGPTAMLSSSAGGFDQQLFANTIDARSRSPHGTSIGQEASQDLRTGGSDHHRRQDQERHRSLLDLNGVVEVEGGREDGKQPGNNGVQQPNTAFEGSEGAPNPTTPPSIGPATLVGASAVWAKLLEAGEHPQCSSPPCKEGRHILEEWADLGEEMSHVQGAVVVRRPDLINVMSSPSRLAPAGDLDFVRTLQSYFPLFKSSLFSRMMLEEHGGLLELAGLRRFVDAVKDGNDSAGVFLYTNYANTDEVLARAGDWHGAIPTVMSIADVTFNRNGYFWDEKDFVVPNSCRSMELGSAAASAAAAGTRAPHNVESFEKVVILTQYYGETYYHFLVENMSRLTVVLDVVLENPDIKVAVHWTKDEDTRDYMHQFLELIGIDRGRVLFRNQVHAELAILPPSTVCFKANEATVTMLRHALLQALYPSAGGVAPTLAQPVILLIVRSKRRGLGNSDDVRAALQQSFPSFNVVEFTGNGTVVSQLEAFATASVVVGPHGAGLSNIVVSPQHTPVLEIGPINCPACFLHLAIKLQHIYARHSGSTSWDKACASWYKPDVDEIVDLVRDLLDAKQQADAAGARW